MGGWEAKYWLPKCPRPNSWKHKYVILCGKRDFTDVMKSMVGGWGGYPGWSGGSSVITRVRKEAGEL